MTMGQRILQARLRAGLSQRELAGEVITRNMLSSLEHDAANPSVATLVYLARRLGTTVGHLLGEDSEAAAAFEAGDWRRSRERMTDTERLWLEPIALLREAEQAIEDRRIPYALQLLDRLEGLTSPLFGPELRRKAAILQCRCGKPTQIPEDDALLLRARHALADGRREDAVRYLLARDDRDGEWAYLMGECAFLTGDYADAREHYLRCRETPQVCARLEVCCRELGDYRMAYYYAKKQQSEET